MFDFFGCNSQSQMQTPQFENVQIQMQDRSGNWRTMVITTTYSSQILMEMRNVQRQNPESRVRAVDMNGRLIDML